MDGLTFYIITHFITGFVAVILGTLVFLKNKNNSINKAFGLLSLSVAVWSFSYSIWLLSKNPETALFWSRALNLGATFIPVFYLHWVLRLLKKEGNRLLFFYYVLTFLFAIFSYSDFYISGTKQILQFPYWPQLSWLYLLFLLFGWCSTIIYSNWLLYKEIKKSTGYYREQLKYVSIGSIIGFIGGSTNFPLMMGLSLFPPFGSPLVIAYPLLFGYAMLKYRLMDIRFILGKSAVYALSFGFIIPFAFLLVIILNKFLTPVSFNITGVIILIVSILAFNPIFNFFEKIASKYFYYTFYSYQKVLTELGKKLTKVLDIEKLSSLIINTLIETVKLDRTVILLKNDRGEYKIQKNIGFKEDNGISLVKDNFLTDWMEKTQHPLVNEEISIIIRNTDDKAKRDSLENLKKNMGKIEAVVCLPLLIEGKIIGMIVLGNKISGDPYSQQDIELLTNLSNQASVALQNAKLYDQVEDLSQNLQEKVDEQTAELKKAYDDLKILDKAKSEFISIASHQLRTPLTAIKGYVSLIKENSYGKVPKKMEKPLDSVYISNERLIKLVNDLLNLSRIEAGKVELKSEKTSIEKIIESIIDELQNIAKNKGLKLIWEKPKKEFPKVFVDTDKIRHAIFNLVDNAIRYTDAGSIIINMEIKDKKLEISVKDTGRGISREDLTKLFNSFSRGSAGKTIHTEGVGLGLYIAKSFTEMHNGKVRAESEGEGKGSVFTIELPIN
jgi:signal transduction histidine kinase